MRFDTRERTVSYLPLSKMSCIRINCCKCSAVLELPPAKEAMKRSEGKCPACGAPFYSQSVPGGDLVTTLAKVLLSFDQLHAQIRIELPVVKGD